MAFTNPQTVPMAEGGGHHHLFRPVSIRFD